VFRQNQFTKISFTKEHIIIILRQAKEYQEYEKSKKDSTCPSSVLPLINLLDALYEIRYMLGLEIGTLHPYWHSNRMFATL
jgi:hypothetical protein